MSDGVGVKIPKKGARMVSPVPRVSLGYECSFCLKAHEMTFPSRARSGAVHSLQAFLARPSLSFFVAHRIASVVSIIASYDTLHIP
jgi:hypothetical protein